MNPIDLNDPRLTAYALDEMAPAERAEFEQTLQHNPAATAAVEAIRQAAVLLTAALECEPLAAMAEAPARPNVSSVPSGKGRDPYAKAVRFPYWMVSSLAAACFALVFIYWQRHQLPVEIKHYIEVPLGPPADAKDQMKSKAANDKGIAVTMASAPADLPTVPPVPTTLMEQSQADVSASVVGRLDQGPVRSQVRLNYVAGAAARKKEAGSGLEEAKKNWSAAAGVAAPIARARLEDTAPAVTGGMAATGSAEAYAYRKENPFLTAGQNPLSTFSVDVDTASYANVRRFLDQGRLPPVDAVRIEEMVNYFPYGYAGPENTPGANGAAPAPFAAHLEVAAAPWAPTHRLVRIGLKGREVSEAARPAANLVFLLDVSGSMNEPNKLPLVKQALRMLVERLRPDDRVAIAVYAGASGLALPSTRASRKNEILEAIDRLQASGSTNGAMGIQLAYDIAKANFIPDGVNRVILATDGDFNVGVTSEGELVRLVGEKAKSGVFLTVLGFGMGNLKDSTLEQLADKGNGNYAYIDSLAEAKKNLVEQVGGTLVTIAKDVKVQVEFNPAKVQAYRLIGYEDRLLAKEDFNNDRVDAGEIGAGHTVTALYEVVPVGAKLPADLATVDALKYQKTEAGETTTEGRNELLTVKLRYKEPTGEASRLLEFPLRDTGATFAQASQDFKFAAAVAAFGMVLRDSPDKGASTLATAAAWGREGLGSDAGGYRHEFIDLVDRAQRLVR